MMATQGRGWPLAILIGIALVLAIMIGLPVVEAFGEQSDEIAQSKADLARYQGEIAARPRLEAELAALNKREASNTGLLRGDSTALAAADMQNLVKALVERHGGQVRSAQNLPASMVGGLEKIDVQYELSIPLGGLKSVAYELETNPTYLFLSDVDIRAENGFVQAGASDAPRDLHVQWTISGYRWAGMP